MSALTKWLDAPDQFPGYVRPAVRWPPGLLSAEREKDITIRPVEQGGLLGMRFAAWRERTSDVGLQTSVTRAHARGKPWGTAREVQLRWLAKVAPLPLRPTLRARQPQLAARAAHGNVNEDNFRVF